MFGFMDAGSRLPDSRLDSLYTAEDFGGGHSRRARVIRELIDEIRRLRGRRDPDAVSG